MAVFYCSYITLSEAVVSVLQQLDYTSLTSRSGKPSVALPWHLLVVVKLSVVIISSCELDHQALIKGPKVIRAIPCGFSR